MRASVDLPEPDLADDAQGLAGLEGEADAVEGAHHLAALASHQPLGDGVVGGERLDLEQRRAVLQLPLGQLASAGNGRKQAPGIGVLGCLEDVAHRAPIDDCAIVHHHHPIGGVGHHAQVVGDQQEAHAEFLLQLLQQCQDLRLDGDVERRRRLVGDQQCWLQRQRHGDHHPLPLAAGELVRVVVDPTRGVRDADPVEQPHSRLAQIAGMAPVRLEALGDLPADRVDRVEMRQRVLEDHRDAPAVDVAALRPAHRQQIMALEENAAAGDVAGRAVDDVHDGRRGHALAGAAFAEDRQCLAGIEMEVDAAHRLDDALCGVELDAEVQDLEQMVLGLAHGFLPPTSSRQRWVGSVTTRSQLESRLSESVASMIARPGKKASHQAVFR